MQRDNHNNGADADDHEDTIFVEDFDEQADPTFIVKVLKPYFTDIYNDLFMRVPKGTQGVNKTVLVSYLGLPEVVGSHFYDLIDSKKNGYISNDQFCEAMSQIYVAPLDARMKFTFKMLDFDFDG